MPMRLCEMCRRAENPLGRLKFKKHLDGNVYCEGCAPVNVEEMLPTSPAPLSASTEASAGSSSTSKSMVVIPCPDCFGQGRATRNPTHANLNKCKACAGYGQVRIPTNFLNVYRPNVSGPQTLTEG